MVLPSSGRQEVLKCRKFTRLLSLLLCIKPWTGKFCFATLHHQSLVKFAFTVSLLFSPDCSSKVGHAVAGLKEAAMQTLPVSSWFCSSDVLK